MAEWLTKDQRMQLHEVREDYIEIFTLELSYVRKIQRYVIRLLISGRQSSFV